MAKECSIAGCEKPAKSRGWCHAHYKRWLRFDDPMAGGVVVGRGRHRKWRDFKQAREFARGLGLKGQLEWTDWLKSGEKPVDIPSDPRKVYKDVGWEGFEDWLDSARWRREWALANPRWRSFEDARELVRGLNLKNFQEWQDWCKSGEKPKDIPVAPNALYKDEGWLHWSDWLGSGGQRYGGWRSFEDAREFARGLGLKKQLEWFDWTKSGEKPADIPSYPNDVYEKWRGWGDWLDSVRWRREWALKNPRWRSFEDAREFVQGFGIQGEPGWREWCKSGEKPDDIPFKPSQVYKDEWESWPDFLGYSPMRWDRLPLLAFLESLRPVLPRLSESELLAIIAQRGAMPNLMRKFGTTSPLSVIKDLKESAGRGLEEAVKGSTDEEDAEEETADAEAVAEEIAAEVAEVLNGETVVESDDEGLPTLLTPESLRDVDALVNLPGGLPEETAEYLVSSRVADLWDAYIRGKSTEDLLVGEGEHYFEIIRSRFEGEREAVESLPVPEGWSFHMNGSGVLPPNAMQKRTAYQVLTKGRVGNWSGAGTGKTLSAILASRVVGAGSTLVVAANATVEGWAEVITNAYPDSVVHTRPEAPVPGAYNYYVINYEKFQTRNRGVFIRQFLRHCKLDFVVLDEVQLVKQRDPEASRRRQALQGLIQVRERQNPHLRVLGMSATPVINNLYEARKLLEVVQGRSFGDLETRPTVMNAMAVHRALKVHGFRYKARYKVKLGEPRVIETVRNDLIDELRAASGILGTEQALLRAKLEVLRARNEIRPGTLIYTHYVDRMIHSTRRFIEGLRFEGRRLRVGVYTGEDKTGLKDFLKGRVDVLIGSAPVATGVDGLQNVCNRVVVLSPPWTGAEYEQLLGRVWRQGSSFDHVEIIWPQVILDRAGDRWSWDARRRQVIDYKRTLSDCAVDGRVPEAHSINPATLLVKSREALEEWIERLKANSYTPTERPVLEVPLPPELRELARVKHGDFTEINNRWINSNSETIHERLQADPSEWELYHTLYEEARTHWEEIPAEHIAEQVSGRPDLEIGDFGCGMNLLKAALPEGARVVGLDHVAKDDSVIACDMAHTPLEEASLDAAVFSLSLMGRNWDEYLAEAHRVLKPFGLLFVAEPARRWKDLAGSIGEAGFSVIDSYQRGEFVYVQGIRKV